MGHACTEPMPAWFALWCVIFGLCMLATRRSPLRPITRWAVVGSAVWLALAIQAYFATYLAVVAWPDGVRCWELDSKAGVPLGISSIVFALTALVARGLDVPPRPDVVPGCRATMRRGRPR